MKIQILIDNRSSWIIPYGLKLVREIEQLKPESEITITHEHKEITKGDLLIMLSCEKIFKKLELNKFNLVVHESDLPKGKGWSPLTWQILEGKNTIPITLFEAAESVDSGKIYFKDKIEFDGTELVDELRAKQGEKTVELILNFVKKFPSIEGQEQSGESTFYEKRTSKNSELNIDKTIREQFNLLRVCDNEKYPAFFILDGKKYKISIEHFH